MKFQYGARKKNGSSSVHIINVYTHEHVKVEWFMGLAALQPLADKKKEFIMKKVFCSINILVMRVRVEGNKHIFQHFFFQQSDLQHLKISFFHFRLTFKRCNVHWDRETARNKIK